MAATNMPQKTKQKKRSQPTKKSQLQAITREPQKRRKTPSMKKKTMQIKTIAKSSKDTTRIK